jgi:WS/DGAT/MGAT family acyltransferase
VDVSYLMLDSDSNAVDDEPAPGRPTLDATADADTGAGAGAEAGGASGLAALPGRAVSTLAGGARLGIRGAALPVKAARSAAGLLRPAPAREAMERARAAIELVVRDEVVAAPATSINRPIGAHRRLALDQFALADLKAIKAALGGTVNDVVLSATAAGLRELLLSRGEAPPEQGLRAMVPVNIRAVGEHGDLGNKVSSLFVDLAVTESEPLARYRSQMEAAEALKSGRQALGSTTVVAIGSLAPPALHSFVAHALFGTRLFNVTITNVPGPQMPLYASGARMREVWPLVPIAADHAVGLAVISYDGEMFFCLNVDRDSTEDVGVLAAGIRSEIEALLTLARGNGGGGDVR